MITTIENLIEKLDKLDKDEKLSDRLYAWKSLLEISSSYDCAYVKDNFVFIGIPLDKDGLSLLFKYDLITENSFEFKGCEINELEEDVEPSLLIMYELINDEPYPVIAMNTPSPDIPEDCRDTIFNAFIAMYTKMNFTTTGDDTDTLEIE